MDEYFQQHRKRRAVCGPVAASYCLTRMGYDAPVARAISLAPLNDNGILVSDLLALVPRLTPSVRPIAVSGEPERIRELPTPCILLLKSHCVVYNGCDHSSGEILVFDPTTRRDARERMEDVKRFWGGTAILFRSPELSVGVYYAIAVCFAVAGIMVGGTALGWFTNVRAPAKSELSS